VLDVYGLVSAERIKALSASIAAGNHAEMVRLVDECDAEGRDLARLLGDLQGCIRSALLDAIARNGRSSLLGTPMRTEQLTRLLDALREGESRVKLGLSEKINFEVTLLKAVEASRARAIDTLIQEIAALSSQLPDESADSAEGSKKKP